MCPGCSWPVRRVPAVKHPAKMQSCPVFTASGCVRRPRWGSGRVQKLCLHAVSRGVVSGCSQAGRAGPHRLGPAAADRQ
eukprot:4831366-Alexandrium_andersonii.AAC.1